MKKKMFLMLIVCIPFLVYAEECPIISNDDTSLSRTLTCDANNITNTSYKTIEKKNVLEDDKNEVCTIKCSEELIFSFEPIKKVLAGMSFSYPLYVSGERKCEAIYNYDNYEKKIKELVNSTSATRDAELVNYYDQKKKCDQFIVSDSDYYNKYKLNANVELKLETSTETKSIKYKYQDIDEYYSNYKEYNTTYEACDYDEITKKCKNATKTIDSWVSTSRIYGKYTMPNTYVEKYTGETNDTVKANFCNAGDRYFVDLNELTKPVVDVKNDTGYKLTLTATNLNGIFDENNTWDLTVNCFYEVNNLIFPQGGNTSEKEDENYSEYGNQAFMYRIIDLSDPFPNRNPFANWIGKTKIFETNGVEDFEININRSSLRRIREYNENYKYDTFNLNEMEKSLFIENNPSIIVRK